VVTVFVLNPERNGIQQENPRLVFAARRRVIIFAAAVAYLVCPGEQLEPADGLFIASDQRDCRYHYHC
jgi:hypothetical protein